MNFSFYKGFRLVVSIKRRLTKLLVTGLQYCPNGIINQVFQEFGFAGLIGLAPVE